jgi:hypothetical protein
LTIYVLEDTAPPPETIRCTCGSYDIRIRTSAPGQEARISYLICDTCQRNWKVRGQVLRALLILEYKA